MALIEFFNQPLGRWIKRLLYIGGFISIVLGVHFYGIAMGKVSCTTVKDEKGNIVPNLGTTYSNNSDEYRGGIAGMTIGGILLFILYSVDAIQAGSKTY